MSTFAVVAVLQWLLMIQMIVDDGCGKFLLLLLLLLFPGFCFRFAVAIFHFAVTAVESVARHKTDQNCCW